MVHIGLMHCNSCKCKFKDFCAVPFYEKNLVKGTFTRIATNLEVEDLTTTCQRQTITNFCSTLNTNSLIFFIFLALNIGMLLVYRCLS